MLKYKVGDIIKCKVTGISLYGFFVCVDDYTGLCHISEISSDFVADINDFVHIGENIYAQVLDINEETKQIKISIKDIYYKIENDGRIIETRKGFLTLKNVLPIWINEKLEEYNNGK